VGDVSRAGIDRHEASPVAQGVKTFIERLESGVVSCGEIIHPDVRLAQRVREADTDGPGAQLSADPCSMAVDAFLSLT
jgi:hypothetical protein